MNTTLMARHGARRRMAGVTLIELMMVVVVVAVLGAIAIPNYRTYSMRAQRTEAKSALLQLAANQERFYTRNGNTFTQVLGDINMQATTENDRYQLAVTVANATTFTATATAINEMTDDAKCQVFTITADGAQTASPDPDGNCW